MYNNFEYEKLRNKRSIASDENNKQLKEAANAYNSTQSTKSKEVDTSKQYATEQAESTSSGALKGAGQGAAAGAAAGPYGAAIGAVAGMATGILGAKAKQEAVQKQNDINARKAISNIIQTGTNRQSDILSDRQRNQAAVLANLMR